MVSVFFLSLQFSGKNRLRNREGWTLGFGMDFVLLLGGSLVVVCFRFGVHAFGICLDGPNCNQLSVQKLFVSAHICSRLNFALKYDDRYSPKYFREQIYLKFRNAVDIMSSKKHGTRSDL